MTLFRRGPAKKAGQAFRRYTFEFALTVLAGILIAAIAKWLGL